jgi:hypothetical protein
LKNYLHGKTTNLDCSPGPRGWNALKFAVLHAAAVSLTEADCVERLGADRTQLVASLRRGTEVSLAKADLLNTVDLSTLQALTLFIVGSSQLRSLFRDLLKRLPGHILR